MSATDRLWAPAFNITSLKGVPIAEAVVHAPEPYVVPMLLEYCGWTRDVDWGNAPSWAAVVVAGIVGAFTCVNVVTARRAYVEGKWDAKVAQARRVYAQDHRQQTLAKGAEWHGFGLSATPDHTFGKYYLTNKQDRLSGVVGQTATEDLIAVYAEFVNASDEPMGEVVVELRHPNGDVVQTEHRFTPRVLSPNSKVTAALFAPFSLPDPPSADSFPKVCLLFTDSAGHRWVRESTATPMEISSP